MRISGDLVKEYEDDICFTIKIDECIMEAVEPKKDVVGPIAYEVVNDILTRYASTLLASPLEPKKKRTGTYLERIKSSEVPMGTKGKAVPSASTPVTSAAKPKVTKRTPAKKIPEAILAKVFKRTWKTRNHSPDLEDSELEVEVKKMRQSTKKMKTIDNVPTISTPVNIDISSYKPMTHCQSIVKNIRRKVLDDIKDYFDDFNDNEKEDVEEERIKYLCINDWSPFETKSIMPKSLFNFLDKKWCIAIEKEQDIREKNFAQNFPNVSNSELFEIIDKHKGIFFMRRRRLLLLEGKSSEVEEDTHLKVKTIVNMQNVYEASWMAEQEPDPSTTIPDEVFDNIAEQNEPIDVDALDIKETTPYVEEDAKERLEKEQKEKEEKEKQE